jgi:hypothetical protein
MGPDVTPAFARIAEDITRDGFAFCSGKGH